MAKAATATLLKVLAFAGGAALLAWIASETDLTAVTDAIFRVGWGGAAIIVATFAIGFTADVGAWALMFDVPRFASMGRLWLIQMVGEGANVLLPFGSLGGEPIKAMLLKRQFNVSYTEGGTTLLLIQTINTLAEVPFVITGLVVMQHHHLLSPAVETAMLAAVVILTTFIVGLFVALHLRLLVSLQHRLARSRWGERLVQGLAVLGDIEQRLYTFIRHRPARFFSSIAMAFANWLFGAIEVFLILRFLGAPVDLMDAWMLEACVVLARNATFFIPGHLGSQDGAITVIAGALTGSPEMGLAVALVRRARELSWSAVGLGIGSWLGLKPSGDQPDQR